MLEPNPEKKRCLKSHAVETVQDIEEKFILVRLHHVAHDPGVFLSKYLNVDRHKAWKLKNFTQVYDRESYMIYYIVLVI
jgi:hypothetical protein